MNIRQIEIIFGDVNETDEKPHTATFVQMDIHGKELTMNMTLRIKQIIANHLSQMKIENVKIMTQVTNHEQIKILILQQMNSNANTEHQKQLNDLSIMDILGYVEKVVMAQILNYVINVNHDIHGILMNETMEIVQNEIEMTVNVQEMIANEIEIMVNVQEMIVN